MSQAGMVVHWTRLGGQGWRSKAVINGLGAIASAVVALVAGGTKFVSGDPLFQVFGFDVRAGSWIVIAPVPLLIANFLGIHHHYQRAREEVTVETPKPIRSWSASACGTSSARSAHWFPR